MVALKSGKFQGASMNYCIGYLLGSTLANFYIFFFWSWKQHHVAKGSLARTLIHTLYWVSITGLIFIFLILIPHEASIDLTWWVFPVVSTVWMALVTIKYKLLMWPKTSSGSSTVSLEP
jgi:hypothetical protein